MSWTQSSYARALRRPGVLRLLAASLGVRIPLGAAVVVVVLYVVQDLHHSYALAGLVATTLGVATAIGSPWRGRLVDRRGLRAALGPSILVLAVAGAACAWVGFWPLLVLTAAIGLYAIPALAVVRSALDAVGGDQLRSTMMALDAIAADGAYLLGPAGGIALATLFGNRVALTVCLVGYAAGGLLLWLLNPARADEPAESPSAKAGWRIPGGTASALIVALAFASAVVDSGGELSTVAAMTGWHQTELIGLVISTWAVGSIIGGLVYGALPVRPSAVVLLFGMAATFALVAVAWTGLVFALLLCVNGLFIAPGYAAISSDLTATAPAGRRAEALSWQSGAMMLGGAVGTPTAGVMIDSFGWQFGLLMPAAVALLVVLANAAYGPRVQRR